MSHYQSMVQQQDTWQQKLSQLTQLVQQERADHGRQVKVWEEERQQLQQQHDRAVQQHEERYQSLQDRYQECVHTDLPLLRQGLDERQAQIRTYQQQIQDLRHELDEVTTNFQQVEAREQSDLQQVQEFMEQLEQQAAILEERELRLEREGRPHGPSLAAVLTQWRRETSDSIGESVSKWIRTVLLPAMEDEARRGSPDGDRDVMTAKQYLLDMETQICDLQQQYDQVRQEQHTDGTTITKQLEHERQTKYELLQEIRLYRDKEQQLYGEIQRLTKERQIEMQRRRRESRDFALDDANPYRDNDDDDTDQKDASTIVADEEHHQLQRREYEIQQKEEFLMHMELSLHDKEQQISEANERLRAMASQLLSLQQQQQPSPSKVVAD